jgi:glycosyltransferase involved in cell wall biosynthesis
LEQNNIFANTAIAHAFRNLKVCVMIPTYNNAATIETVIKNVQQYTADILVINDGSTDDTQKIITEIPNIYIVHYTPNRGKGCALRTGFKKAIELGFRHVITIDSDGQHFAKDLPIFIQKLQEEKSALIMGARNMNTTENVPGKSSFGNQFSNFWYRFETGIRLPDTQTGYRLYPLEPIKKMKFFTRKYEFEIEVIVRLAWAGVKVVSVPVSVYYPPAEERISHFRPFKDFFRISVLNTVLVTICFFYIFPRNFFRFLFRNKNLKKDLRNILLNPNESDFTKANSMAFGGFMGVVPIWGFQLLVGIPLAHFMRLNKTLFIIAAHISIPPMIPVIVFLSFLMGKPFMGNKAVSIDFSKEITLQTMRMQIEQYLFGSIVLAVIVAVAFWMITFIFLKTYRKTKTLFTNKNGQQL